MSLRTPNDLRAPERDDRRSRGLAGLLLVVGLASCGGGGEPEPAEGRGARAARPPLDVVVVMIDTLRPDHLGLHGFERETAPFLAELAARSTVFERAHSTSCWTAPSVASLFTGLYPGEHGITIGFFVNAIRNRELLELGRTTMELNRFGEGARTLPVLMKEAGYRTFGLAANPNIGAEIGFDRGFDHFERLFDMGDRLDAPAEEMEARFLEWEPLLAEEGADFVYLHLNDPHDPLDPRDPWYEAPASPEEQGAEDRARYLSEIGYLDAALARLYERLGWGEDTLLVVVSDHGEEFWEHGRRGHATSLYGEQNRVVMMFHAPGLVAEGRRVEENVSLIDVLPTVLELLGLPSESTSGVSLVPFLAPGRPDASLEREHVFAHWINPAPVPEEVPEVPDTAHLWAVLHDRWRLVQSDDRVELFDEVADPGNQVDLAPEHEALVEGLLRELEAFQARELAGVSERVEVELDPASVEALERLGYGGGGDAE